MKTSSAARILLCSLICFGHGAYADNVLNAQDMDIIKSGNNISKSEQATVVPQNRFQSTANQEARSFYKSIKQSGSAQMSLPESPKINGRILLFASFSLGQSAIDDIFDLSDKYPDSVIVFRGVVDENNLAKAILDIQTAAAKHKPVPKVVIDPTLFKKYGVSKVPTIVCLDETLTSEVSRVAGLASPDWLLSQVKYKSLGDHGTRGPVFDIKERDLIELLKGKVAALDWKQKKDQALERFWTKQQFLTLPVAPTDRHKSVDPSIYLTNDIQGADGAVIVPQGTRINPLEHVAFNQALVIFDPLDPRQLAVALTNYKALLKKYPKVTLIATQFDSTAGWNFYRDLTNKFDAPVFKLTSDVSQRFNLEFSPSIVTAQGDHFDIQEIAIK